MPEILRMPEVAAGATEAILSAWNVPVGQAFAAGDLLVTIETDKAVVDVEAEADGVLLRLLAEAGATVEVGSPIAVTGAVGQVELMLQQMRREPAHNRRRQASSRSRIRGPRRPREVSMCPRAISRS